MPNNLNTQDQALSSKIIFGPINSRRFGKSLGIDLSPSKKQCNLIVSTVSSSPQKQSIVIVMY